MQKSLLIRFITASGVTNLADGIATVAWAWLASLLTRDPLMIALVPVALRLPWFVCAIPAGIITDRVDRRKLILWMDVLRGLAFVVVALVLWSVTPLVDAPQTGTSYPAVFGMVLLAAMAVGIAEVFRDNAAQTMLPAIVPHEALERANGRLWSVELVGNALLGPAVGATLIAIAVPLPFALNALAYVMAVVLIWQMAGNFRPQAQSDRHWRRELMQAVQFLRGNPLLLALAWITGFWNLLYEMVAIGLILHAQENLDIGAQTYGLILAAGAVGGIFGGWCGDPVIRRLGGKRTAQWMLALSAPAFAGMALAPGPVALGIVLMLFSFTGLVWNTVSVSYRQRAIPDAMLGRVNSLYRLLAWGMMPVGLLLSGMIVRLAEAPLGRDLALTAPFWVGTLGAAVLGALGWRALNRWFPT
ncbi:MFS transporter [Sulfitobacter mediterraneus]|uniref:MFS transporter n=1 Tax=Sulfitobacter mediterraneus TaxID=83219 RepID=UPI001939427F|nr:MFS transporter [Sulfitobacter mediterraneus]MBM1558261.1 MFS transporter [Sulfitobacter mediterraneus]MBM1568639.1 MFS transporter [Sulfitobacter mediterraneus]MBM1573467.1 MFS transporter [Sulfitobacter mediterraneus]MBM1576360.1 MFS transporter [Sulfitobacter mediterraneus]MBM1581250.1 MFS transporter [Sulfitobacter mediterraneus]